MGDRAKLHKGQRVRVDHENGVEYGTVDSVTVDPVQVTVHLDDDTYCWFPGNWVTPVPTPLRLTFVGAGQTVELGEYTANDGLLCIQVDGEPIVGIDLFYAAGGDSCGDDPNPAAPREPHINIGHWTEPEGEGYDVLAFKPQPSKEH